MKYLNLKTAQLHCGIPYSWCMTIATFTSKEKQKNKIHTYINILGNFLYFVAININCKHASKQKPTDRMSRAHLSFSLTFMYPLRIYYVTPPNPKIYIMIFTKVYVKTARTAVIIK